MLERMEHGFVGNQDESCLHTICTEATTERSPLVFSFGIITIIVLVVEVVVGDDFIYSDRDR